MLTPDCILIIPGSIDGAIDSATAPEALSIALKFTAALRYLA
jgi:hypothetical protein